ncbi:MAG: ChaN family lipoprotein [Oligoflexales bacterium]
MLLRYLFVFTFIFLMIQCIHTSWQATHHVNHPLVGKILDKNSGELIEFSEFNNNIMNSRPDLILLGEVHDHPDHHILHLKILKSLDQRNLLGSLFLEHFDLGQNKTLNNIFNGPDPFIDLEKKLNWSQGWDDFRFYEPMLKTAWKAKQKIKGVNISRKHLKMLVNGKKVEVLSEEEIQRINKIPSISKILEDSLAEEIVRSHCDMFPKKHAAPIVNAQILRDKIMSHLLFGSLAPKKISVFIGGNGHMRKDRGVPYYLAPLDPSLRLLSVGFIQVNQEKTDLDSYADLPYDLIFFTPVFDVSDLCKKFRKSLEEMKK